MTTKKKQPKRVAAKVTSVPSRTDVSFHPGKLTVSFDHPKQILPTLLNLSSHLADQHINSAEGVTDEILGSARARSIVSGCASSSCFTCTLADVQIPPAVFQTCVFNHVRQAGFTIGFDQIPATASTQLEDVVIAIQDALAGS